MSIFVAAAAALGGMNPAWREHYSFHEQWEDCLEKRAYELASGKDSAELIAGSVVYLCEPFLRYFVYGIPINVVDLRGQDKENFEEALRQKQNEDYDVERRDGVEKAKLYVLQARAR